MINYYVIEIVGRKPRRFLNKIFKENINIFDITYSRNKIVCKVSYESYKKIKELNTIYEIKILSTKGIKRMNYLIKKYQIFLMFLLFSIFLTILLSHFIFLINIETNNMNMKHVIEEELHNHNITLLSYKKSYNELSKISKDIKNKHKDKIEWIYISNNGVCLNVKFIERINNSPKENNNLTDIVAARNGYIRDIYSKSGDIMKVKGDYVKKGDIIISGNILRNENLVAKVKASGKVYAEVWYNVKLSTPLKVTKEIKSNNGTKTWYLEVFNKEIPILKINKKINQEENKVLLKSPIVTLHLKKQFQKTKKNEKLDNNKLQAYLEKEAKKEIEKKLKDKEHILLQKTLKKEVKNGKMYIEVFFKTYQNIAKEQPIQEIEETEEIKKEE